jgi:trigger factor
MQENAQTAGALERRIDLSIATSDIRSEVANRLNRLARTVKMPGFRPGKVPMKMVASAYGAQVETEVLQDRVGKAFQDEVTARQMRVAGSPRLEAQPAAGEGEDRLRFSAVFEIYPEVKVADLSVVAVSRAACTVGDAEIDKTLEIMRKQRATYEPTSEPAVHGDRLTIDFTGKLDGVAFDGGSASDFAFELGAGRMLPDFETGLTGRRAGETVEFPVNFPADYHAANLAGKQAMFSASVKEVQHPRLPEIDAEFARTLGVADGDLAKMRAEVRSNLEREVRGRLRARAKDAVMKALEPLAAFELPRALIEAEQQQLAEMARRDLVSRGIDAKEAPLPLEAFEPQARRRVKLGLLVAEIVRNEKLAARQDQVRRRIEEMAQSYEKPAEVIQWYLGNRERLADIEAMVVEDNVVDWVLTRAQVSEVAVGFDDLMGNAA